MSKLMDVAEKEVMRTEILEICEQSVPIGADERVIRAALRKNGYDVTEKEVQEALYYLQGKGLVELVAAENRALGIHRTVARITAAGMDCLDGNAEVSGMDIGG